MTPHNEASKEDIAKIVLMSGDPKRVEAIALKFLTNYRLVNSVRGALAYTGYYKDILVTVMASGMGIPSMGIYSYELFKFYDVDYIIRIGTAGTLVDSLKVLDLFLVEESYSESTYALKAFNDSSNIFKSSKRLNEIIEKEAINLNCNLQKGRVVCTDTFYDQKDIFDLVNNKKCLSVEMETFALFSNAKHLNKQAACLLTISDSCIKDESLSADDRQNIFFNVVKIALESIKHLK